MSKLERKSPQAAEAPDLDLSQFLSDLNGLERLQTMQLTLVRALRQQLEAAQGTAADGTARSRRSKARG